MTFPLERGHQEEGIGERERAREGVREGERERGSDIGRGREEYVYISDYRVWTHTTKDKEQIQKEKLVC